MNYLADILRAAGIEPGTVAHTMEALLQDPNDQKLAAFARVLRLIVTLPQASYLTAEAKDLHCDLLAIIAVERKWLYHHPTP